MIQSHAGLGFAFVGSKGLHVLGAEFKEVLSSLPSFCPQVQPGPGMEQWHGKGREDLTRRKVLWYLPKWALVATVWKKTVGKSEDNFTPFSKKSLFVTNFEQDWVASFKKSSVLWWFSSVDPWSYMHGWIVLSTHCRGNWAAHWVSVYSLISYLLNDSARHAHLLGLSWGFH